MNVILDFRFNLMIFNTSCFSNIASDDMLFSETDLDASMEKIETLNFHQVTILHVIMNLYCRIRQVRLSYCSSCIQVQDLNGIKFWCYHAGHVLGACMFMIEIAGVRVS